MNEIRNFLFNPDCQEDRQNIMGIATTTQIISSAVKIGSLGLEILGAALLMSSYPISGILIIGIGGIGYVLSHDAEKVSKNGLAILRETTTSAQASLTASRFSNQLL